MVSSSIFIGHLYLETSGMLTKRSRFWPSAATFIRSLNRAPRSGATCRCIGHLVDLVALLGVGGDAGAAQPVDGRMVGIFRVDEFLTCAATHSFQRRQSQENLGSFEPRVKITIPTKQGSGA